MRIPATVPLATAAVAVATLVLTRVAVPAAAVFAFAATWSALRWRAAAFGFAALPVLLASLPRAGPSSPACRPGPVAVHGVVERVVRDPGIGEIELFVATAGGLLRLSTGPPLGVLPGDRIDAVARCSPPSVPGGVPRLGAAAAAIEVEPGAWSLQRAAAGLRQRLEDRLLALLPGETGALVCSLVLGAGTRLPADVAAAHRATGLSHLLAVSGAHAAMLAWLLGLQPFGGRHRRVGRVHLVAGLLALAGYGLLTGLEPPVFRALCSYGLAALALCTGRRIGVVQVLAWPALVSCIVAPEGVLGASFCLSYAAVAGLGLAGRAASASALERWVAGPVRASFWATVATAPLTLLWFGQLAPWTVLLTPLLAPLVAALLFLGLGTGLLALALPWLAATVLAPALHGLAAAYLALVQAADALPWTPVLAPFRPDPVVVAAGCVCGAAVALALASRRGVLAGCVLACLPHFVVAGPPQPPELHLLAVGHGQACLLRTAGGAQVVVDCGSMQHPVLPARKLERLLRRRRIDLLVLTHGDRDHVGAVPALLACARVTTAVVPAALRGHDVALALASAGTAIEWLASGGRLEPIPGVQIAAPAPGPDGSSNDCSLWVRCDIGGTTVLLPADAEERGIAAALAAGVATPCDVLVLPHHGRANAAVPALLAATRPSVCLVSNRGSEGASALAGDAARSGVPTFATGECGDLTIRCDPEPSLQAGGALRLPRREPERPP